ncbi:hypothetical protein [Streptomyces canus]|uniref:hypothetical protein n=1 Tax=Streptomyces canus TaxID=58343 RepID=UPI0030E03E7D
MRARAAVEVAAGERGATLRTAPPQAPPAPSTVRQVADWLTRHPTDLTEEDRAALKTSWPAAPSWTQPPHTSAPSANS